MNEDDFQEIIRVQQLMTQRIMQERKVDSKIDLLNIINELTDNGRKRTQVEAVLIEANHNNISDSEANTILDELERDHLVKRLKNGFIETT